MPTCRSCEAEVVFVRSDHSTATMILDAKPEKRLVLHNVMGENGPSLWFGPLDKTARARVVDAYTDHHATCPDAKAWTGRTRADRQEPRDTPVIPGWPVADS